MNAHYSTLPSRHAPTARRHRCKKGRLPGHMQTNQITWEAISRDMGSAMTYMTSKQQNEQNAPPPVGLRCTTGMHALREAVRALEWGGTGREGVWTMAAFGAAFGAPTLGTHTGIWFSAPSAWEGPSCSGMLRTCSHAHRGREQGHCTVPSHMAPAQQQHVERGRACHPHPKCCLVGGNHLPPSARPADRIVVVLW